MTRTTGRILLAVEGPAPRAFLTDNLTADGYHVLAVEDRAGALIADVNGDTLTLIDAIRGADGLASRIAPDTPLIVLTAQTSELARIRYLDRGGDDVLAKPYSYLELRARLRALLRRAEATAPGRIIRIGELEIDTLARDVHASGTRVGLAAREYALLVHLAGDPTKVFTKSELLRDLWGFHARGTTRTLEAHAIRLRTKLRAAGETSWLETVWGVGYRLAPIGPREDDPVAA
jgi:DNA-binding response OmpR family regulator